MMMRVEEVTTKECLRRLAPEWQELCDRGENPSPFQTPEWLLPWCAHLFGGGEILVLALRDDGRLMGVAPLFFYGENLACVSFLGAGVSDYLDILLEPRERAVAVETTIDYLRNPRRRWEICELSDLRVGSPVLNFAMPREWRVERSVSAHCPILPLPGTMEELELHISPKLRRNLAYAKNKLPRLGELRFETAMEDQDESFLEALFRLHTKEWASRKDGGIFASEASRRFYREVLRGFRSRGYSRLHGLRFDGQLRAILWCFVVERRAYYYISGFDPSFAHFSPGALLLEYAIGSAIEEGLEEFDFLRGNEPYKYRWGAADRLNFRLRIQN